MNEWMKIMNRGFGFTFDASFDFSLIWIQNFESKEHPGVTGIYIKS